MLLVPAKVRWYVTLSAGEAEGSFGSISQAFRQPNRFLVLTQFL